MPVRASTRSGRSPSGVAARRRSASRRSAGRRSPRAARLQALQAVGAVQGSSLGPVLRRGDSETAALGREAKQGSARGREEGGTGEGTDRPGRRRVEVGAGVAPPASNPGGSRTSRGRRAGRRRRARCPGTRLGISPGSRPLPATGTARLRGDVPAARAAAATQPAASPWDERPSTGAPVTSNRAAASRSRPSRKCDHPASLGPVAGGGEGECDGRRVTGPDVGPTVAGAGDDGPGSAVGQSPQDEQRALVHPPRPGRRTAPQRPGRGQPAPVSGGGSGPSEPADERWRCVAEPGDGPQHVGPRQVALVDWSASQNGSRASSTDQRHDPRVRRHRPGGLALGRYLHQRPSRPERAHVDDVAVGVDRPDGPPVPDEGRRGTGSASPESPAACRVGRRPPRESEGRRDDDAYCHCRTSPVHPPMQSALRPAGR